MNIVLLVGSHPRHAFLARSIARTGALAGLVVENREDHLPQSPPPMAEATAALFHRHFHERAEAEAAHFGRTVEFPAVPTLRVRQDEINGEGVAGFVCRHRAALLLSYGVHKLAKELLANVDGRCWNIHAGLSPWYRGAITHFWPSYLLEPQMTGMTVHEITEVLDGGGLVHQTTAPLVRGDGIHDLACRAVTAIAEELPSLLSQAASGALKSARSQTTNGRIWRSADWRPAHLHLVYDVYGNRIVDRYLDGEFGPPAPPKLFRQF